MVEGWLPRETVGMVVAPPGSYKTWLLQDLAVSVATGLPFLGQFRVPRPGPVLFIQQEDWHGQVAQRFALIVSRRAGIELPSMLGGHLNVSIPPLAPIHIHEHRRFRFDDEEALQASVEKIRALRPSLVILDPLYSAGRMDDYMAGTARDMFLFKELRDAYGTAFLIAHHTRKTGRESNGKEQGREEAWGSQFLNAWLETGWQVRRKDALGEIGVLRHFKSAGEALQASVTFDIDTTVVPGRYEVAVKEATSEAVKEEKEDVIRLLEVNGPLSPNRIAAMTGLHRTTIFRRMENLVTAGVVTRQEGKYALKED